MKLRRLGRNMSVWEEDDAKWKPPEIPDVYGSKFQRLDHPIVLRVSITVFVCPQSMSNTLEGVNDGASKIVSGVDLPLVTKSM